MPVYGLSPLTGFERNLRHKWERASFFPLLGGGEAGAWGTRPRATQVVEDCGVELAGHQVA